MPSTVFTPGRHATLVRDFLEDSARRLPEKIALICDGHRLTYSALDAMANRLAQALAQLGVQRGDRVAVFMPNSVETVVAIFAIVKAGGVFVVINPTTKRDKLIYILNNCRATALITEARIDLEGIAPRSTSTVPSLLGCIRCGHGPA